MAPKPHYISDSPGVDVCSTLFDDACKGGGRMADEVSHWVFMTDDEKRAIWERIRREALRCVSVVTNGELPGTAFRVPGTGGRT